MEGIEFLKELINFLGIGIKYGLYYVVGPICIFAFICNMLDESEDKKTELKERQ